METKRIEGMGTWFALKQAIIEKGYKLWQTQYGWDLPEGFIVGFMREDRRLEVITRNRGIEEDINKSGLSEL